jgi:hypothetical protein
MATSLSTIQKPKAKKTLIPKIDLVQWFLNDRPSIGADNENLLSSLKGSSRNKLLPRFDKNILNKLSITANLRFGSNNSQSSLETNDGEKSKASCEQYGANDSRSLNLTSFLAKEFFKDCKQRLDTNTFDNLLSLFGKYRDHSQTAAASDAKELNSENIVNELLDRIFNLIYKDQNLCNKFSAFLVSENAIYYDLLTQSCQFEKCLHLFNILEVIISLFLF